jgi:predicted aspartyl protease
MSSRFRYWALFAAVAGLAGCQASTGGACRLNFMGSLPLTAIKHGWTVPAEINGHAVPLELGFNANVSVIAAATAYRVGMHPVGETVGMQSAGGQRDAVPMGADHIMIGTLTGNDMWFYAPQGALPPGRHQDPNLLGMDALGQFDIDLDLAGHKINLYQTAGKTKCTTPVVLLAQPLYSVPEIGDAWDSHIYIPVVIHGQTLKASVDPTSDRSSLMWRAAMRIGITPADLSSDRKIDNYNITRRYVPGAVHRIDSATVGSLTINNLPVLIEDFPNPVDDMILGRDFFDKVHVWISNSSHSVVMQMPPLPSPPVRAATHVP